MPELPEVETIRSVIEHQIVGQTVLSVAVHNPKVIAYPNEQLFAKLLTGQTIQNMSRRGKFLTIHFADGDRVTIHLRMTGQLLVTPAEHPIEKHTHLIAELSGGKQIRYIDVRRFGRFWYLKAEEADEITGQSKLGLEPFDQGLTAAYLQEKMGKRKKPVKEMLLDQSVVAGIGNIYADEILFEAKIFPEEKCTDLETEDWQQLADKIKEIIGWGIEINRMTAEEYLETQGKEYHNMPELRAYGRGGQLCGRCRTTMEKIVIAGRSSCYCPYCQRKR